MSLDELRRKIDEVDSKIVRLLAERIRIVQEIGEGKKKKCRQIEDKQREAIVLEHVRSIAREENLKQEDIEAIYQQILTISKNNLFGINRGFDSPDRF